MTSRGIFRPTPSNGLAFRARQQRQRARGTTINAFAEALADGATVPQAARQLGLSADYGRALLGRIRRDLGWQAR